MHLVRLGYGEIRSRYEYTKVGFYMTIKTTIGDFRDFGVRIFQDTAVFTFETKTDEAPAILLYDRADKTLAATVELDTSFAFGRVYSVKLKGVNWKDVCYLLRRDGEVSMDEYAPVVIGREKWYDPSREAEGYRVYGGFAVQRKSRPVPPKRIATEDMVLYKLHLRGYTMQSTLSEKKKGNYRGILSRLPYLKELGVTSLEFMPLYEFEDIRYSMSFKPDKKGRVRQVPGEPEGVNYWGYGDAYYFAPKSSYFGGERPDVHMRDMVTAIHRAGMEIIMEMSFDPELPEDLIRRSLVYWVREYGVDGFHLLGAGLPAERIADDPFLGATKILYDGFSTEVLEFGRKDRRLLVTNDDFVFPLRRLQNHLDGTAGEMANLLRRQGRGYSFVNYAASNTGFCLWDAYSYSEKHNEANGENNSDGSNYNCSHNHGCEGESKSRMIIRSRMTAMRTAFAAVMLSQGVPMIYAGDEIANTQQGNNNPYCQDNEVGWVDFSRKKLPRELREYVIRLIRFRKEHSVLRLPEPMHLNDYKHTGMPDLSYHGREPWIMGIGAEKKALGILLNGYYAKENNADDIMICFNFYFGEETFALPKLHGKRKWYYVTNTGKGDWDPAEKPMEDQRLIIVPGGTLTILVGKEDYEETKLSLQTEKRRRKL